LQSNLERECVQEQCNAEELNEAMHIIINTPNDHNSIKAVKFLNNGEYPEPKQNFSTLVDLFSDNQDKACRTKSQYLLKANEQLKDPVPIDAGCSAIGTTKCKSGYLKRECICKDTMERIVIIIL